VEHLENKFGSLTNWFTTLNNLLRLTVNYLLCSLKTARRTLKEGLLDRFLLLK